MQVQSGRIALLDALRMVACIMVMAYHYLFIGPLEGNWPSTMTVKAFYVGNFGVDLFFMISGFVITLSSQGRTPFRFLTARINRIVPTFVVCGLIIYCFAIALPGISPLERARSLLLSLTFIPKVFGRDYFTSVYWTLTFEVTFYVWVYLFIRTGIWDTYRNTICVIWCAISLLNNYLLHATWMTYVFISEYSGCFIAGIVLYQLKTQAFRLIHGVLLVTCLILIQLKMQAYNQWINGYNAGVSQTVLWIVAFVLLALAWAVSKVKTLPFGSRQAAFLGALSYPLYLLHADIGFWSHAMFERTWFDTYPWTREVFSYPMMMLLAVVVSVGLAVMVVKLGEPVFSRIMTRFWQRFTP